MYMAGIIVLMLGIHFRLVESVVLTDQATQFVAEKMESLDLANSTPNMFTRVPAAKKVITPPRWLGWSLLSIGGVMVLHSLAMRKQ
jgi:hypothetical protein